jgi:long-subunit acyl-CoA synthetase (AMP-forming)
LLRIPILRRFVAKKVLTQLGLDHVRFAGSGSAPIPGEVIDWYRRLGLELLEGYGMSENFAYSHVTRPGEVRVGYVGGTYPGVHCRISDTGEIEVKSPGTMLGYYKAPELTSECLTPDGYLKTGDRGEIDEKGRLKITGRVKELFKTSKGKYVSPAPIENKLVTNEHIEQACVTGPGQPQPHAVIQLSEETRAALDAGRLTREQISTDLEHLIETVNETLDPHEHLEFVAIAQDPWQVENGYLTPTLKLKRAKVESEFTPRAEGWYRARKRVLWS